jgi:hypothetical protein
MAADVPAVAVEAREVEGVGLLPKTESSPAKRISTPSE